MAKDIPDPILDLMLAEAEGTTMHLCSAQPANYAGIAAVELGQKTISGSYTKAAGDVSGRKNTCPAQSAIPVTASGNATHVAISNGTDTLRLVTTCASTALVENGTADVSAFAHELRDPS